MLFIRGCKRNDGRHSPQFLKRSGELAQHHGALEAEVFSTPSLAGVVDVLGETYGVKSDESGSYVVKLTATADGQAWEIVDGPFTEQIAERKARELANPPKDEPEPIVEDLISDAWERRVAA